MNHPVITHEIERVPAPSSPSAETVVQLHRYFNLDFARAVAILLVTGFHVWRFHGEPAGLAGPLLARGFVGVDLFFVVSGYAMMLTHEKMPGGGWSHTLKFWAARLLRIYPAYLVAMAFWAVMVRQGVAVKPAGVYDIVTHVFMLHTFDSDTFFSISGVFWSLAIETHFYLLFPLLVRAPRKLRLGLGAASLVLTLCLEILLSGKTNSNVIVLKWNVITFLPLFIVGMELYACRSVQNKWDKLGGVLAGLLALVLMYHPGLLNVDSHSDNTSSFMLTRIVVGAALGFFCLRLIPGEVPKNRFINTISLIGMSSYSIYLFNYVFWIARSPLLPGAAGILTTSLAVLMFGILMWWLLEQPCEDMRHALMKRLNKTPSGVAILLKD